MMASLPSDELQSGLSLVFWMKDPPQVPISKYAEGDYLLCRDLWKNHLHCTFEAYEDPSRDDIHQAAKDMIDNNVDVTSGTFNYLAVTFIGHGGGGSKEDVDDNGSNRDLNYAFLHLKNGERCTVAELQDLFRNTYFQYCFFFVQACRGSKMETLAPADGSSARPTYPRWPTYRSAEKTASANILTVYPSFKENKGYYYPESGESILIRTICKIFKAKCHLPNNDINTMLIDVSAGVAEWNKERNLMILPKGKGNSECAQTVWVESSITEKFYFSTVKRSGTSTSATGSSDVNTHTTQASLMDTHSSATGSSAASTQNTQASPMESDKNDQLLKAVGNSDQTAVRKLLKNPEDLDDVTIIVAYELAQKKEHIVISTYLDLAKKKLKSQHKDGSSTTIEVKGSGNSTASSGNASSTTTNYYGENDEKKRRLQ